MNDIKVCIVGQVVVDAHYQGNRSHIIRMGGIMHAARAMWALNYPYVLAYIAPEYLDAQIRDHATQYAATGIEKIGNVLGCPNVLIVAGSKEYGPQGYEFILRDEHRSELDVATLSAIYKNGDISDTILFPGGFDLPSILDVIGKSDSRVYADINFAPNDPKELDALGRKLDTCILSTSSQTFLQKYKGQATEVCSDIVGKYAESLLLKENRGGSRFFDGSQEIATTAQIRKVEHSVGVGDCFNAVFATLRIKFDDRIALAYASYIAAEYATCWDDEAFRTATQATMKIPPSEMVQLQGISLPWEARPSVQIYVAAPDFDFVDTRPIDRIIESLNYHNFTPRLPIRENGQMGDNASRERRQALFNADMELLRECRMLVAVLLYDDPGTLIEIGIAAERGLPVLVYDPYRKAENLVLTELPNVITASMDEIMLNVFRYASRASA